MRNIKFIIGFVSCILTSITYAQVTSGDLVTLHSVTTTEMNNLTPTATAGALVFNTDALRVYEFDGTNWLQIAVEDNIINTVTGNYTFTPADSNNIVFVNNGTNDITLTIPTGLPIGFTVSVYQQVTTATAGTVSIAGATGVTLRNRLNRTIMAGQNSGIGIVSLAANVFYLTGDLKR